MRSIADLLDEAGVRHRAGADAYVEGNRLAEANAVQFVRFAPLVVTAEVDDRAAHVEFTVLHDELRSSCTCDEGRDGAFCAHCVATAVITWRKVRGTRGRAERAAPGSATR